jgi:hypothetical protein
MVIQSGQNSAFISHTFRISLASKSYSDRLHIMWLSLFAVATKRNLLSIPIGESHMGLAWGIQVIPLWEQIDSEI